MKIHTVCILRSDYECKIHTVCILRSDYECKIINVPVKNYLLSLYIKNNVPCEFVFTFFYICSFSCKTPRAAMERLSIISVLVKAPKSQYPAKSAQETLFSLVSMSWKTPEKVSLSESNNYNVWVSMSRKLRNRSYI